MLAHFSTIWRQWTAPHISVTQPEIRRQGQLLATIALILLFLALTTYTIPQILQIYPTTLMEAALMYSGFGLWGVAYIVGRRGQYQRGAIILITATSGMVFGSTAIAEGLTPDWTFYYILLPILICTVFLSQRFTIGFIAANIIMMLLMSELMPNVVQEDVPVIFTLVFSTIIVTFDYHRRRLEQDRQASLVESETRYRTLFESINEAIAVTEDGHLRDVNPAFEQMFGVICSQIYDDKITRFIGPQETEQYQEVVAHRADGTPFYSEVLSRRLQRGDQHLEVASIRDITDRKLAAKNEIDLALEREKVKLMQQFINDASHDLRTPLTVIYTSIHLLRKSESLDDRTTRQLNRLDQQAQHLNSMIENLINLARLDKAAHNRLQFTQSDLNLLLQEATDEQRPYAETERVNICNKFDDAIPPLFLDPKEIQRAIRQLLMNAIRYTPEGGQICVISVMQSDKILIQVEDTGIGIDEDDLEKIFNLFYRADPARQSDAGGMGIGLNICQRIVEAHDGQITVESKTGKGTTFTIHLPIKTSESVGVDIS